MKVLQEKAKFTPITITLETAEEAEALWYALVRDDDETLEAYFMRTNIEPKKQAEITKALDGMFGDYDEVYNLDNDC